MCFPNVFTSQSASNFDKSLDFIHLTPDKISPNTKNICNGHYQPGAAVPFTFALVFPPAHNADLAPPMSALPVEDFPYVPKEDHVSSLDDFCELDHTLVQHTSSPSSPSRARKESKHGEATNVRGLDKKTSDKGNVRRIMSSSYHAKTATGAMPSRKKSRVFAVIGESGSGKTSLLRYWSKQRKLMTKTHSMMEKSLQRGGEDRDDDELAASNYQLPPVINLYDLFLNLWV